MRTEKERIYESMVPWIDPKELPGVIINDVTLRDGKQALPWYNLPNKDQSAKFVSCLADAGVHHAEIGFPAVEGDLETKCVEHVVDVNKDRKIMLFALSRLVSSDIETAMKTLNPARYKGIHTFIGLSKEHLNSRNFSYEKVKIMVKDCVKRIVENEFVCQFSGEDMTRAFLQGQQNIIDSTFVDDVYGVAVENGATILNHPDTLGVNYPSQYASIVKGRVDLFPEQVHATHTHNDASMAEANAIEGLLQGGARRIEGTVCGIGERAGNADWMSILMSIYSASKGEWGDEYIPYAQNILSTPERVSAIYDQFVAMTGVDQRPVAPGYGYFAQVNRSGIHQAEVAKMKSTYLWMDTDHFGFEERPHFDINPLSGKGGVSALCKEVGVDIPEGKTLLLFTAFIRDIFSPDTNPHDIDDHFTSITADALKSIATDIYKIRQEASMLKATPDNEMKWMQETREVFKKAYDLYC